MLELDLPPHAATAGTAACTAACAAACADEHADEHADDRADRRPDRREHGPARTPAPDTGHAPAQPAAVRAARVWVVEDDEVVALYLGELLRDAGHAVATYVDPRRALHAFQLDPQAMDVVVTDHRMPGLSGEALARALLARRPGLRIVLCTAYSDRLDERAARALGIAHYLRKPFDAQALLRAVGAGQGPR
jgi:CheY-like chemotaxis protein